MESGVDSALNTTIEIPEDGEVSLPYERRIRVEHMDRVEFESKVNALYGGLYRGSPGIRVKIIEPTRLVYVGGLVQTPGFYKIKNNSSFQELFALAGGLDIEPNTGRSPRFAIVQTPVGTSLGAIDLQNFFRGSVSTEHFEWRGAEKVFVQMDPPRKDFHDTDSGTIQILGQVLNPGEYPVTGTADFFSYLALAGGPTAEADLSAVEIITQSDDSVVRRRWSVDDSKEMPTLVAGDMLVIGARQPETVVPTFTGVLGAISAAIIAAVAL
jgi:protein involved in polysaccharide export with SLBB domain